MRAAVAVVVLVSSRVLFLQAPSASASWSMTRFTEGYAMEATGLATDPGGAAVTLRSGDASGGFGRADAKVPAEPFRRRRVSISGELQTRAVAGGASLWIRLERGATRLVLDDGQDDPVRGDAGWTRRVVSVPVPEDATTIVFGVFLQGRGEVVARHIRIDAGDPLPAGATIGPAAARELDAAFAILKTHALTRDGVSWPSVERRVRDYAAGAQTAADAYPAIQYLLAELGDRHSDLLSPVAAKAFNDGRVQNAAPEFGLVDSAVGYVRVPTFQGRRRSVLRTYADQFHRRLSGLASRAVCGWIVDLRDNLGGNMWPMLAGLRPFLGDGPLGAFESASESSSPWRAGDGVGGRRPSSLRALQTAWVAVLIGPRTASSGEAVAIAFRGRPHTRSFGLPTAGLTTSNDMFPLPDHAIIALTTAVDVDRNGQRFGEAVDPDERIEGDRVLEAASRWLRASTHCATLTDSAPIR